MRWALLFLCIGRKGREAEAAVAGLIIRWTRQQLCHSISKLDKVCDRSLWCVYSAIRRAHLFFFSLLFSPLFLLYPIFVSFSLFSGLIASAVAGRTSIRPRKLDARECTSFMARPCVTCTQLDTETLGQLRLPLEADSFPLEHGSFCAVCASLAVSM